MDKNSLLWAQIKRDCDKIMRDDPAECWSSLGNLHAAAGDVDEMRNCYSKALRINNDQAYVTNLLIHLENLGFYSEALGYYRDIGGPSLGHFTERYRYGVAAGAFQAMVQFIDAAKKMEMDMTGLDIDIQLEAAALLHVHGISDEEVARHLDAAGLVMRRHRIFCYGIPEVRATAIDGEFSGVSIVFRVPGSRLDVLALNAALAEQEGAVGIAGRGIFNVMFLPDTNTTLDLSPRERREVA